MQYRIEITEEEASVGLRLMQFALSTANFLHSQMEIKHELDAKDKRAAESLMEKLDIAEATFLRG